MKITYNKLEELGACESGLAWFKNEFGTEQEVEFKELIKCNNYEWIRWLMQEIPDYQTKENLKLYLTMNPSCIDFSCLIIHVPAYQTQGNYDILKQMEKENL